MKSCLFKHPVSVSIRLQSHTSTNRSVPGECRPIPSAVERFYSYEIEWTLIERTQGTSFSRYLPSLSRSRTPGFDPFDTRGRCPSPRNDTKKKLAWVSSPTTAWAAFVSSSRQSKYLRGARMSPLVRRRSGRPRPWREGRKAFGGRKDRRDRRRRVRSVDWCASCKGCLAHSMEGASGFVARIGNENEPWIASCRRATSLRRPHSYTVQDRTSLLPSLKS